MTRRLMVLMLLLIVAAVPLSASQFIHQPFDRMVRQSTMIIRGTVGPVMSSWNDSHDVIYTRALVQVDNYFIGDGPSILPVREVGGSVDGYTQEAIGFPALREGEEVILFLREWEDGSDYRINAYSQGKYLIRRDMTQREFVTHDPAEQGVERDASRIRALQSSVGEGMDMSEFEMMVFAAGRARGPRAEQQ